MNLNLRSGCNPLGYGVTGKNILLELVKQHHQTAFFPIGQIQLDSQDDVPIIEETIRNQDSFDYEAPSVLIWHQHSLAEHVGRGLHCGFPIFELNKFNEREKHHLASQDLLFTCSQWGRRVIIDNLPDFDSEKIFVVPLGVNTNIFKPSYLDSQDIPKNNPTIFFNCGKMEIRKSHDILIDAFNIAFNKDDNVILQMLWSNPFLKPEDTKVWEEKYLDSPLGQQGKIQLLDRVKTHSDVADIMNKATCGVFPSRAEGWNLELLEMMACGKQVIATDYSAHTEFCTNKNSLLIPIRELETAYDGIWFHGQGEWASIGEEELDYCVSFLRKVYDLHQSGRLEQNVEGIKTAQKYSWAHSVNCLVEGVNGCRNSYYR
jgi:glycosyltransferase involved in cell wall biosynthesis